MCWKIRRWWWKNIFIKYVLSLYSQKYLYSSWLNKSTFTCYFTQNHEWLWLSVVSLPFLHYTNKQCLTLYYLLNPRSFIFIFLPLLNFGIFTLHVGPFLLLYTIQNEFLQLLVCPFSSFLFTAFSSSSDIFFVCLLSALGHWHI